MKKNIKCVIWDLDNTMWDGTLLEGDDVKLRPGIRDIIDQIDSQGVLQSIASKNNHDDAMKKLQHFGLDEYFLYPEINWNAKSHSISRIAENLNIGLDTFLFIDDQPFERDEVLSALPQVECLEHSDYIKLLDHPRMERKILTVDSRRRRQMYREDILRKEDESQFAGAPDKFLASLDMKFIISDAKEEDLLRAEELTVRTNQLNATGLTFGYEDLLYFMNSDNHRLIICELVDRYGSYGKIGLALLSTDNGTMHLKLLLMSCRVISRGVGTVLISYLLQEAERQNKRFLADFKMTDRNRQMFITYKFANFKVVEQTEDGNILFENDLSLIQPFPSYIDVVIEESASLINQI